MRTSIIILATLFAMLAVSSPALAAVSVDATVDRTTVAPGESVQLQVTVSGGSGEVDLSGLNDFKVLSRGTGSSVQIVNGHMSRETTYTYMLMPRRRGRLAIPALAVDVDGRTYHSEPIDITVTSQPDTGSERSDNQEAWVTAEVSDPSPYAGQQITYTFRLFNTVQIQDARFQAPQFDGFSAKEIKDRRTYRKIVNGREAVVTEIDYVLTPLASGSRTIEPAVLQVGILRQDRSGRRSPFDVFNDPFFNRGTVQTRVLQTDALKVAVQPLPSLPAALKFSGLVGRFDLQAGIEGDGDLKVGDSATLAVTVEGRGNIMDARPPELEIPSAFKTYVDNPQESIDGRGPHRVSRQEDLPHGPGAPGSRPLRAGARDPDLLRRGAEELPDPDGRGAGPDRGRLPADGRAAGHHCAAAHQTL
ncbi:MAG: BatD family protein [Desulfosarcinaceae bacterium]